MKYEKTYTIRQYECGPDFKLSFSSLINFMQDIASDHSVELGVSIVDLLKRGLTWMLSRYHISVERYPHYRETVIFKTWPSKHEGFFTLREYTMEKPNGEILARMTSSFVVYDIKTKKTVNVEKHLFFSDALIKERAIDDEFLSLDLPKKIDNSQEVIIRKHDLDFNRHVNNRALVEMAIESVPMDIMKTHSLKNAQITFKGQAFYRDSLESQCELIAGENKYRIIHHLINKKNNNSVLKMETNWLKGT